MPMPGMSRSERCLWWVMALFQAGNAGDLLTTVWGATTRLWPEQSGMMWAIHELGPVLGPLWVKALFAAAGYAYWQLGRRAISHGALGSALVVLGALFAFLLWYATASNVCVLVTGRPCVPTWHT